MPIEEKERARDTLAGAGATLLDCPVSGNRIVAQRGHLTAFASGDPVALERARPVVEAFTRRMQVVGAFGAGSKMKYLGNILNLVHNSVAAEVMAATVG